MRGSQRRRRILASCLTSVIGLAGTASAPGCGTWQGVATPGVAMGLMRTTFAGMEAGPVTAPWPDGARLAAPQGHLARIGCLAFSPDGRWLVSGSSDQTLLIWDVTTHEVFRRLAGHTGYAHACAFLPDGRQVVSGGWGGEVIIWDLDSGRDVRRMAGLSKRDSVHSLAVRPDGGEVLAGTFDGEVRGWNPRTGEETFTRAAALKLTVWGVGYTSSGERYAGGDGGKIVVWGQTGAVRSIKHHPTSIMALPAGRFLVGTEGEVRLVEAGGKVVRTYPGHSGWVYGLALRADGDRFAAADISGKAWLWNLTGQRQCALQRTEAGLWAAAFALDGRQLAVAGDAGVVWLAAADDCRLLAALDARRSRVSAVTAGSQLALGAGSGRLSLWFGPPWRGNPGNAVHGGGVTGIAELPGWGWVTGGLDRRVVLTRSDGSRLELGEHRQPVRNVHALPDGRALAVDEAGEAWVYEPAYGNRMLLDSVREEGLSTLAVAVAPGGREATMVGESQSPFRIRLPDGKLSRRWPDDFWYETTALAYSEDGRILALGDRRGAVQILDPATGKRPLNQMLALQGLTSPVEDLVFAGSHLWGADMAGHLRRWFLGGDIDPDLPPIDEGASIFGLAKTLDGRHLVAALNDGRAVVRSLPDGILEAWLIPLRDGSWAAIDFERRSFTYQGDAAGALRVELRDGAVRTLAELALARKTSGPSLAFGGLEFEVLPTRQVRLEATLMAPRGQPEVKLDEDSAVEAIERSADNAAMWTVSVLFSGEKPGTAHRLTAHDDTGREQTLPFTLPDGEGLWASARRRALVIGEAHYPQPLALDCAARDVELMRGVLSDRSGWALTGDDLRVRTDLRSENLREELRRFLESAGDDEQLLVYFAGHGEERGGAGYLLPVDHDAGRPGQDVSTQDLWRWVSDSKARQVLLLVDACRSGAFADAFRNLSRDRRRAVIAASSELAQCSSDGSLFTKRFVEVLRDPGSRRPSNFGAVTVEDAFYETRARLREDGQEVVWSQGLGRLPLSFPVPKEEAQAADLVRFDVAKPARGRQVTIEAPRLSTYQQAVPQWSTPGGPVAVNGVLKLDVRLLHPARYMWVRVVHRPSKQVVYEIAPVVNTPPPWPSGVRHVNIPLDRKIRRGDDYNVEVVTADSKDIKDVSRAEALLPFKL